MEELVPNQRVQPSENKVAVDSGVYALKEGSNAASCSHMLRGRQEGSAGRAAFGVERKRAISHRLDRIEESGRDATGNVACYKVGGCPCSSQHFASDGSHRLLQRKEHGG